jgi:6-pyruvoyltetrahydropterin/6-carboxytetrahydropterin synthase
MDGCIFAVRGSRGGGAAMYEISSQTSFSAAHHLSDYNGPCENVHGHNWLVRACVRCNELDATGIGIDFKSLRQLLEKSVADLDHADLNEVFDPLNMNPSSENIARHIFQRLDDLIAAPGCRVSRVEVSETPGNTATYFEDPSA